MLRRFLAARLRAAADTVFGQVRRTVGRPQHAMSSNQIFAGQVFDSTAVSAATIADRLIIFCIPSVG